LNSKPRPCGALNKNRGKTTPGGGITPFWHLDGTDSKGKMSEDFEEESEEQEE